MDIPELEYIYGPVESWRMGKSLGIDPISNREKICNMDCIYCQLGRSKNVFHTRKEYVKTEIILKELRNITQKDIDYITFSGRGEPTLAQNLGDMIKKVKEIRNEKIAVITNATLLHLKEVQQDLSLADLVMLKLDAGTEEIFKTVDQVVDGISLSNCIDAMLDFRKMFTGKLALQMMFVEQNMNDALSMAKIAKAINPDEIQINTPLRPSGESPIIESELLKLKYFFSDLPATVIYEGELKKSNPLNERKTIQRHGNYKIK